MIELPPVTDPHERPQPRRNVMVTVEGTDTDGAACTLLAFHEAGGTWLIHTQDVAPAAVRLPEQEAARLATAILHLVSPQAARAARATANPHDDEIQLTRPEVT